MGGPDSASAPGEGEEGTPTSGNALSLGRNRKGDPTMRGPSSFVAAVMSASADAIRATCVRRWGGGRREREREEKDERKREEE